MQGPADGERVVLINPFEVPRDGDADFMVGWKRRREVLRNQPGYLGTRLHRSLTPEADFRFVNVAPWPSPEAFQKAIADPGFREASASIRHRAHPSLYQVVRQ